MSTYGFSPSTRVLLGLLMAMTGLPLVGILLYFFLGSPDTKVIFTLLILSTIFVIPLIAMLRFYARTRDHIVASEEGLTYHPHTGSPFSISWSQIADLQPRALRNRYDVLDHQGQRLLTISYELEKIDDLDEIIRKKLQNATADNHLAYHVKRPGGIIVLWLIPLVLFPMPFIGLTPRTLVPLLLLPILVIWVLFFEIRRIKIDSQGLTIEYLLRRNRLAFNEVQEVKLQEAGYAIRIERKDQNPLKFSWPRDVDVSRLHKSIEENWQAFIHKRQTNR